MWVVVDIGVVYVMVLFNGYVVVEELVVGCIVVIGWGVDVVFVLIGLMV